MEMDVYHVCTDGLAKGLWFLDDEDYVAGMNSVPVCALLADVTIWCFCLMSNHVHFILKGQRENCLRFIREYKRRRSRQLMMRYKGERKIDGADIFMRMVRNDEDGQGALAYVMRNPMGAGMQLRPGEYRWGSAFLYFSERSFVQGGFRKIGELSERKRQRLFRTEIQMPGSYLVDNNDIIFPGSYVDYRAVEDVYGSVKKLLYFLSSNKDMEEDIKCGILAKARYNDSELVVSLDCLCGERFKGRKYEKLKIEDRYFLAREMKRRYGVGAKQLARVMSLDAGVLKQILK